MAYQTGIEPFLNSPVSCNQEVPGGQYAHGDPTTNDAAGGAASADQQKKDAELMRRVQADDLDAFEEFFARYRNPIYRTAYGLTGDRQAAEEVLQDTFARAYRHRHTFHQGVSPLPWLHRVVAEPLLLAPVAPPARREPIDETAEHTVPDDRPLPAERAEQSELRQIVREGIAALPEKHQSVVVLYYLHRLSLQETAQVLGIQLGTVKSRLHYALRSLRSTSKATGASAAPTCRPARRCRGQGFVMELRGACARHRPALLDFVDRAEIAPGTAERWPISTGAVAARTSWSRWSSRSPRSAGSAMTSPGPSRSRTRGRASGRAWTALDPERWVIMSPSAGMVISVALVAVLVAPLSSVARRRRAPLARSFGCGAGRVPSKPVGSRPPTSQAFARESFRPLRRLRSG